MQKSPIVRALILSVLFSLGVTIYAFAGETEDTSTGYYGVNGFHSDFRAVQSEHDAKVYKGLGFNSIFLEMRSAFGNWPAWQKSRKAWTSAGFSTFWSLPTSIFEVERIFGFPPGTTQTDDRHTTIDGKKEYFAASSSLGNFFDANIESEYLRIARLMSHRIPATGYIATSEVDLGDGPYDEAGKTSWQTFLKAFFSDDTPNEDTNSDGHTFNASFEKRYSSWENVELFSKTELEDARHTAARDLWLANEYSSFTGEMARAAMSGLSGPSYGPGLSSSTDVSLAALDPHIGALYSSSPKNIHVISAASRFAGKPVIAQDVRLSTTSVADAFDTIARCLAFSGSFSGRQSDLFSYETAEDPVVQYEPLEIISQNESLAAVCRLRPFAGLPFVSKPNTLLVTTSASDDYAPFLEDIYSVDVASEFALAIAKTIPDLSKYDYIIYLPTCATLSEKTFSLLLDYAANGGHVIADKTKSIDGKTIKGDDAGQLYPVRTEIEADGRPFISTSIGNGSWTSVVRDMGAIEIMEECKKLFPDCSLEFIKDGAEFYCEKNSTGYTLLFSRDSSAETDITRGKDQLVAFDCKDLRVVDGKHVKTGKGDGARAYILKTKDRPKLIYTGGTTDFPADTGDGEWKSGSLEFNLCDTAWVYSPKSPAAVETGPTGAHYEYDAANNVLCIRSPGKRTDCTVKYE